MNKNLTDKLKEKAREEYDKTPAFNDIVTKDWLDTVIDRTALAVLDMVSDRLPKSLAFPNPKAEGANVMLNEISSRLQALRAEIEGKDFGNPEHRAEAMKDALHDANEEQRTAMIEGKKELLDDDCCPVFHGKKGCCEKCNPTGLEGHCFNTNCPCHLEGKHTHTTGCHYTVGNGLSGCTQPKNRPCECDKPESV